MILPKPINILINEFLSERPITGGSIDTYKRTLNVFVLWMIKSGTADVRSPKKADLVSWKNHLIDTRHSMHTVENYLNVTIFFFKWLESKSYYQNIAEGLKNRQASRGHKKMYLTIEETCRLLGALPSSTVLEKRNAAIVNLLIRTGIRCVEVSRINVSDITPITGGHVMKIQRKGHKEKDQTIGLPNECVELIDSYLTDRGNVNESDPLFINQGYHSMTTELTASTVSRIAVDALKRCGFKTKQTTAHSLRHTAAINALKAGATIFEVKEMLGHTSVNTTQIYLSAIEAETRLVNPAALHLNRYIKEHEEKCAKNDLKGIVVSNNVSKERNFVGI